ncbi:MAG TPA: ATP-binding protein, partial [Tepidisphaeraceae bacterium]|nr:ATP-binding protein [Tepidisphaeraceae bacterium]
CSYMSQRWYEYTGMPRGSALGLGWTAALHAEDTEDLRRQITRPVAAGKPYEVELRLRGADGEYRWFVARCRPIYDEEGRITKWLGSCTDIDQLKRTGEALVASEGRNRALLRVIPDLIFRINSEGVIMDCVANREADLLLPPGRFLGKRLDVVLPAPAGQETMEKIRRALRTGEMQIMEYALTLRGEPRHYEARVVLAGNQEVLAIVRNVTERKQGEQRLRENQEQLRLAKEAAESANKAKDQFLAILSHELRTPLTPVLMSASVMEGNVMLPASIRDEMSMIRRNIELEARLIDDLLDLTRITRGRLALQLQCVDAHELVKQSCQMVRGDAEAKPLTLEMELAADAHHVRGDPARLQQVFCNLLKNAVKFTPAGGQVKIRSSRGENGRLRVEVSDTGIGIDEAMLPKLFHAFEQGDTSISRRFGGLGLGLTISKGLIDLHGGTVSASSDGPGKGAMFRVELPTVEPVQAEATAPAVAKHGPVQSRRILLVEDHGGTALVLARLLREAGHTVETAATVAGAMELVRMSRFDLLISDLALPDGSGVDLMRQIRAQHHDLKAIALTGHGMERDVADTRSVGFRIHLVKPIGFQQLEAAIAELTATE